MVVAARLRVKTARSDGLDSQPSTINPDSIFVALGNPDLPPQAEVGAKFRPCGSARFLKLLGGFSAVRSELEVCCIKSSLILARSSMPFAIGPPPLAPAMSADFSNTS